MADLKRLGMEPRDVDGYCCDTEIGEGDEVIAVLSHLDVVPEGEGWDHDPYGAEIIDGRMIGRGTSDDKGPGVAAVFAMKAILNAGIPLRRRCRLICPYVFPRLYDSFTARPSGSPAPCSARKADR